VQQRKESASLLTNARLYGWLRSSSSVTSGKKETFLKTTHSQLQFFKSWEQTTDAKTKSKFELLEVLVNKFHLHTAISIDIGD
jgi:hypothetical protein